MRFLVLFTILITCPAWSDTTSEHTAGTTIDDSQGDGADCWRNYTATAVADVTDTDDPAQSGRLESVDASAQPTCWIKIENFGFTTGDIPTGSTIDGVNVILHHHGGTSTQAIRRRINLFMYGGDDPSDNDCGPVSGIQGLNGIETVHTLTQDDVGLDPLWSCNIRTMDEFEVRDENFGIEIQKVNSAGSAEQNTNGLDYIAITVDFTPPATGKRRMMIIGFIDLLKEWFGWA